jgi:hypothetical protein
MEQPLVYVFDDFDTAERIYEEFLSNGFDPKGVELTVRDDEAGPVKGNFTVGDAIPDDLKEYDDAFAHPRQRGHVILTVTPVDPNQAQFAIALMARYGVRYPDAKPGGPHASPGAR